jgi:hypothetical protein
MKLDWPFTKWPAIRIPAEADEDACAQALIMRTGSYEAALRVLKRNRDWFKGLPRVVDDRVLLDIAHAEQATPGYIDNARREWEKSVGLRRDEAGSPSVQSMPVVALVPVSSSVETLGNPIKHEPKCRDNAVLTKVANKAYRGKEAVAALRRLRYKLHGKSLHEFWRKRWSRLFP